MVRELVNLQTNRGLSVPFLVNISGRTYGGLAELVDALDLGSSVERRAGSSPVSPTMLSGLCNFNRMNPVIKALGAGERTGALCKGDD